MSSAPLKSVHSVVSNNPPKKSRRGNMIPVKQKNEINNNDNDCSEYIIQKQVII